jgi:hypothetical protein
VLQSCVYTSYIYIHTQNISSVNMHAGCVEEGLLFDKSPAEKY